MTAIPARPRGRKTALNSSTRVLSDERADFTEKTGTAVTVPLSPTQKADQTGTMVTVLLLPDQTGAMVMVPVLPMQKPDQTGTAVTAPPLPTQKPDQIQQSPRGLLTNTTRFGWDREHGLWRDETGAIRGQEPRRLIADYISMWRKLASGRIEVSNKNPKDYYEIANGDVLDRACAAALVLKQLDYVEIYLRQIDRDFADRSAPILNLLYAALLLATRVHHLTIADHEIGIATTIDRRRFLSDSRKIKSGRYKQQRRFFQESADKIWREHPDWSKSRVAEAIAKKPIRGLTANVNTIRRQIEKTKLTK